MKNLVGYICILVLGQLITVQTASADEFVRLGEQKRGVVTDLAVVDLGVENSYHAFSPSNRIVTAMRDGEDKLRLMVWEISDAGVPEVIANVATQGTIKGVSIARVDANRVVTAVRDGADKLRLIVWDIVENGRGIARRGTRVARRIRDVKIAGQANNAVDRANGRVFTAARDWSGDLFVADWKVTPNGEIRRPTTAVYGPISQIDIKSGHREYYLISAAMRDGSEKLRLIPFQGSDRSGVTRWGPIGTGGKISEVRTSGYNVGDVVFTATISQGPVGVHNGYLAGRLLVDAGILKVIRWEHERQSSDETANDMRANRLFRKHESEVGGISGMAVTADIMLLHGRSPTTDGAVVTAHAGFGSYRRLLRRDQGKPELRLLAWTWKLGQTAHATLGGDYRIVEMAPVRAVGDSSRFVTALRGVRGELKVVVWALNPS